jgi:hypothetical protein
MKDTPLDPEYITLNEYMRISGDGRSTAYAKIADGRLLAVKDGKRLKINYPHARAHLRSLPPAQIRLVAREPSA